MNSGNGIEPKLHGSRYIVEKHYFHNSSYNKTIKIHDQFEFNFNLILF